jgi:2-C-methyl-D-erythritol 4-phosphate cytidylyltransferase
MGSLTPKQFLVLDGRPLIFHTIRAMLKYFEDPQVLVPVPKEWISLAESLWLKEGLKADVRFIKGGAERYDSIKNALPLVLGKYVAIHDAVRPFVSKGTVERLQKGIEACGAVIPVLDMKESLRIKQETGSMALDRSLYISVHTPQCFTYEIIRKAYEQKFDAQVTDDACLVERTGVKITLVASNEENIKITTPMDWLLAKQLTTKE